MEDKKKPVNSYYVLNPLLIVSTCEVMLCFIPILQTRKLKLRESI